MNEELNQAVEYIHHRIGLLMLTEPRCITDTDVLQQIDALHYECLYTQFSAQELLIAYREQ